MNYWTLNYNHGKNKITLLSDSVYCPLFQTVKNEENILKTPYDIL